MSNIIERFDKINSNIKKIKSERSVNIVAVSKTFSFEHIKPLIDHGHTHFGENKVQEGLAKWSNYKRENQHLKLHMVGKLQSNKAKDAYKLFDYIHSLDSKKLADIFSKCENKWCLQDGPTKPQYTMCESLDNDGNTCMNPQIKYGNVF